jgi:hypothetical protein
MNKHDVTFLVRSTRGVALRQALAGIFSIALVQISHAQQPLERPVALPELQFQEQLRSLERVGNAVEQARQAGRWMRERWLSCQQVKAIAKTIAHEDARFDFAVAAYPRTVDPENFYEVYDAFTSYSKVFRLHDQIQRMRAPSPLPGQQPPVVQQPITDEAFADMLRALRAEAMEDTKKSLARQMLAGRPRFLSRQIRDVVKVFTFDDARLEIAQYAYDAALDPENYYLVSQALTFSDRRESLARYIESRRTGKPGHSNR